MKLRNALNARQSSPDLARHLVVETAHALLCAHRWLAALPEPDAEALAADGHPRGALLIALERDPGLAQRLRALQVKHDL